MEGDASVVIVLVVLPLFLFRPFHLLPVLLLLMFRFLLVLLLRLALRLPLFLPGHEMLAVIVVPIVAVDVVLGVAVRPDRLEVVPAQARREVPVPHGRPRAAAAGCPEPAPVAAEVVAVLH